jgi:hypothetical protein
LESAGQSFWDAVRQFSAAVAAFAQRVGFGSSARQVPPAGQQGVEGSIGPIGVPGKPVDNQGPSFNGGRAVPQGYELETPPGSDVSGGRVRPYLRPVPDIIGSFPPSKEGATYRYDPDKGTVVVAPDKNLEIDPLKSFKEGHAAEVAEEHKRRWKINQNISPGYFTPSGEPINQSGYLPGFADGGEVGMDERRARIIAGWRALLGQHLGHASMFDPKAGGLGLQMFADSAGLIGSLRGISSFFTSLFGPERHFSPMGGGQWSGMARGGSIFSPGIAKLLDVGGSVFGPGTSTSDSIPAMLSNGEFVIRASAADRIGLPLLHLLNGLASGGPVRMSGAAMMKGLADGGPASDVLSSSDNGSASSSSGASPSSLTLNIGGKPHTIRTPDHQVLQQMARAALEDSMLEIVPAQDSVR